MLYEVITGFGSTGRLPLWAGTYKSPAQIAWQSLSHNPVPARRVITSYSIHYTKLYEVVSYEDVAIQVGIPGATRAVGSAVGKNPISFIILV